MKCCWCSEKEAKEKFGAYCSQECRNKAINKTKKQIEQNKKRRIQSEIRKFESYLKSGKRTL